MGTHPIFESDFDCLTVNLDWCSSRTGVDYRMPGVQNKYSIDVTNRFNVDDEQDDVDDNEQVEDVDPFEELKILKQKAAEAKNVPKQKQVIKKKAVPTNTKVEIEREGTGNRRKQTGNNERKTGNNDKPRERRPKPPRTSDDKGGIEERPRREYKGERRGERTPRGERTFDRKSRDPKSSNKAFDKKDGSGSGNWGNTNDELTGQTEKIDQETRDQTGNEQKEERPVEPEEPPTMTLEEYRNKSRNIKRNPNAKITEEKTTETVKATQADVKRKGRAGRVAPVDFRPAPLVQRGGDRKGRRDNQGQKQQYERKQKNDAGSGAAYNLADDFPSL